MTSVLLTYTHIFTTSHKSLFCFHITHVSLMFFLLHVYKHIYNLIQEPDSSPGLQEWQPNAAMKHLSSTDRPCHLAKPLSEMQPMCNEPKLWYMFVLVIQALIPDPIIIMPPTPQPWPCLFAIPCVSDRKGRLTVCPWCTLMAFCCG